MGICSQHGTPMRRQLRPDYAKDVEVLEFGTIREVQQ
jgi:hypothetical protein